MSRLLFAYISIYMSLALPISLDGRLSFISYNVSSVQHFRDEDICGDIYGEGNMYGTTMDQDDTCEIEWWVVRIGFSFRRNCAHIKCVYCIPSGSLYRKAKVEGKNMIYRSVCSITNPVGISIDFAHTHTYMWTTCLGSYTYCTQSTQQ